MDAETQPASFDMTREIKLQLPLRQHVLLRSHRLLTSKTFRGLISEALHLYFRNHPLQEAPPSVEAGVAFSGSTELRLPLAPVA